MAGRPYYWHIHHAVLVEQTYGAISTRRTYIKKRKPTAEVALRLALLRPVKAQDKVAAAYADYDAVYKAVGNHFSYTLAERKQLKAAKTKLVAKIEKLHAKECEKDCPWHSNKTQISWDDWIVGTIFSPGWKKHRLAVSK